MITVTLYSRTDCRLCDQALSDLDTLRESFPHRLVILDIDQDEDLRQQYGERIPVVEVGPYKLFAPFQRQELQVTLGAALDRVNQLEKVGGPTYAKEKERAQTISRSDRFTYWLSKHYLSVLNLLVFLYVGLPFLAPILMNSGVTGPATVIYRMYGAVCHQLAFRSWFLFGEQPVYPRETANVPDMLTFGEVSGIDEDDLVDSRFYIGDEVVGYKVAYCQRDVAIYGGILVFGLIYGITRKRLPPLPWYLWIGIGMLPIALDGFSQLLSQDPFNFWPVRESTPILRTVTGFLFGFTTAWFGYPYVEQSMGEARRALTVKFARQ